MTPYFRSGSIEIYNGDCISIMAAMEANRFARVITDPPYHLTTGKRGGTGAASLNADSPMQHPEIAGLILLSRRANAHSIPDTLNDKPIRIVSLWSQGI